MNIRTLINRAVWQYPDNTALVYGENRYTFAELNARVNRLANGLLALGLEKGERVGMLMNNCTEFIEVDFALAKSGLVRVPLNARLLGADHEYILNDAGAKALIFGDEHAGTVAEMRERLPAVEHFVLVARKPETPVLFACHNYKVLQESASSGEPEVAVDAEDLHTLFYTSGTTGKPKGVMLTQTSWANVVINLALDYGPFETEDILLNTQLLSHGAGFFVLPLFIYGATNVLMARADTQCIFETVQREKVTVLKLVPSILYQLIQFKQKVHYDLSSLKTIIYGGSPIAVPRLVEALQFFGPKLVQLYGQAEVPMCISFLAKRDHVWKGSAEVVKRLQSAGKPCTNVEVRVVDGDGRDLPQETVGEVIVRGDHRFDGYWNNPRETVETLKDGWVHTGDLGRFDNRGFLFLVERKKDMIISGGFNIYPKEIETVIVSHPDVQETAVIGVPHDRWGEAVKAIVVAKPGIELNEKQIIDFCKKHLPGFKKPKSVDFFENLPRNPYGKVLKTELRKPYWKDITRRIN